jgi:ATP-binding cassette subfamily B protein
MSVFKFGFTYWKKRLFIAVFCQVIGFIAILFGLFTPLFGQMIIDYVLTYNSNNEVTNSIFSFLLSGKYGDLGSFKLFLSIAVTFLILIVIRVILLYIRNNLFQRNGIKMENELRKDTYKKLLSLSSSTILNHNTGDLLNTLNNDTIMFKELYCFNMLCIFDSIFMLLTSSFLLISIHPLFLLIPIIISPILIYYLKKFVKAARDISKKIRNTNADMNMTVQENIHAIRIVRSFANEDFEMQKFDYSNENIKQAYFTHANVTSKYSVLFNTLRQCAYIASIAIGTILIFKGNLHVGSLVACSGYTVFMMDLITNLNNYFFNFQQQLVSGERIMNFLQTEVSINDPEYPEFMKSAADIKLNNVSLIIGEHQLLKNINLDIPKGKKIGIMGRTGSGKTILLKSLSRIIDISSGNITINGTDIKNYKLEDVRSKFSYVFQDVFLFSNTIDSNIAFANPEALHETVVTTAKIAQADDFIKKLPNGYETVIGERGLGLSGGQKQRISIARAILKDAPVLVLDDATSALDLFTEKALLSSIKNIYPEKSVLIAAHRASSVKECDEIIYIQDGEIVERGTFNELIALNGHYAAIYNKQSAGGEIKDINVNELNLYEHDSDAEIAKEA